MSNQINQAAGKQLHQLTVSEAAKLIAAGEVSPVELTRVALDRIEKYGSDLAAFTTVHAQEAMKVAEASEMMLKVGHNLGPLHGVPIAIKDNISIAGRVTSGASKVLAGNVASADSEVVRRLKAAGANPIANTNMHELAWGGTSENPHFGCVRNPWDLERIASGSSGGSGAAVAARLVPAALGTDTGGSVRLPASVNGLTGIRPTIGRVSNRGIIPLAWSMDTCGPMTHTVEDCALLMQIMAGHDGGEGGTANVPVSDYLAELNGGVSGLRIGVIPEYFFQQVQPAVLKATKNSLEVFKTLGAKVVEVNIQDLDANLSALMTVESAEPSAFHQHWLRNCPEQYGEDVRFMFEQGELYLAGHYIQAQRFRKILRARFMERFADSVDFFVLPTLPFTAPIIGTPEVELEPGVIRPMLEAIMRFTGIASVTGLPGLNIQGGFDHKNLPIGIQLLGRPFDESTLFRAGHAFQKVTDYHTKAPAFGSD